MFPHESETRRWTTDPCLIVFPDIEPFFSQPRRVDDRQTAEVTSSGGYNLREQY